MLVLQKMSSRIRFLLADGILAGIERVCAEPGRAAQGTQHHRGGLLSVRAGTSLPLLQGKINLRKAAAIALILAGVVVFFWE